MKSILEYLKTLYGLERTGIKYSLKNITSLLKEIESPHLKTKFIHIAGTNGKGGTASFLASILMEHGLKTGLFTSPHLFKFNERIQINGKFISDSFIKSFVNDNLKFIKKIKASFFEVSTAIAFKYFADKNVDVAVIETGLGGRLDSTNVINAELCIITQIGIDHTQYLGNTLTKIAKEKLGIVKKGNPVIVSDNNSSLKQIFKNRLRDNPVFYLDKLVKIQSVNSLVGKMFFTADIRFMTDKINSVNFQIPVVGEYQIRNACTAILATFSYLNSQQINPSIQKMKSGLLHVKKNTFYHGRFEVLKNKTTKYIFDVSHNSEAIKLSTKTSNDFKIKAIIFGIMNDKDYKSALNYLKKINVVIIFTKPSYKRARDPKDLFDYYKSISKNRTKNSWWTADFNKALIKLKDFRNEDGFVYILGSFFLVSEAIEKLGLKSGLSKY